MNEHENQSKTTPRFVADSRTGPSKEIQQTDATMRGRVSEPRVYRLAEFLGESEPPHTCDGQRWGDWILDTNHRTLEYVPDGIKQYEIDLDRCADSAEMLDWIFQVRDKGWADAHVMKDLLDALEEIFHPQENLCTNGVNKRNNPAEFLPQRFGARARKK